MNKKTCVSCNGSGAKRNCPALGGICGPCCGSKRNSAIRCSAECPNNPFGVSNYNEWLKLDGSWGHKCFGYLVDHYSYNEHSLKNELRKYMLVEGNEEEDLISDAAPLLMHAKLFWKISVNGGAPVVLCDAVNLQGAWWNEDETIIYSEVTRNIMRISANGGTPESIVKGKSLNLSDPQILPDGKSVLYTSWLSSTQRKIMVQSLKSGDTKELFSGSDARYLPTGHIIFKSADNNILSAISFNLEKLEVRGGPVSVLEGIFQYAISESGTLAYLPEAAVGAAVGRTLVWLNREGKEESLSAPPMEYLHLGISSDGKRVALQVASPSHNIWIWDVAREAMTRLTLDEGNDNTDPLWTPDGKRIVYTSSSESVFSGDIYWKAADGTGDAEKLAASSPGRGLYPRSWSGDGKTMVIWDLTLSPPQADIGMLSMEGDHARKPLLQEKHYEAGPKISPDGQWMAYSSNRSGKSEVYVRPFPDVNKGQWQVSTSGGDTPLWSPDGRELFYRSGDAAMGVPVDTEPVFKPGKPTVLFRGKFHQPVLGQTYWDISPDGKRFLTLKDAASTPSAAAGPRKINIVLNWLEELKQRVPVK